LHHLVHVKAVPIHQDLLSGKRERLPGHVERAVFSCRDVLIVARERFGIDAVDQERVFVVPFLDDIGNEEMDIRRRELLPVLGDDGIDDVVALVIDTAPIDGLRGFPIAATGVNAPDPVAVTVP